MLDFSLVSLHSGFCAKTPNLRDLLLQNRTPTLIGIETLNSSGDFLSIENLDRAGW
jgi:hypothetical protein